MSYSETVSGRAAIVGMGAVFPDSENKEKYWSLIKNGRDAIREIPDTHWKTSDYYDANPKAPDMTYSKTGGFIKPFDFDPMEFGITPNSLEAIDSSHILGLVAAKSALDDAGYGKGGKELPKETTGVILGITGAQELVIGLGARLGHPLWKKSVLEAGGDQELADDVAKRIGAGYPEWQELSFPGLLGNVAAGRIANYFDLGGVNCVIDAACGSSLGALEMAYMELISKRADVMLTGGVDTFNDIFMYMCFSKTPAMSPDGTAKPFSADGNGTCLGEGVGIVMLKRYEDAVRDGDRIYAVIEGTGSGSDGKGAAVFAPQSKGQAKAIRRAYLSSGINPHTVGMIEAHGTGTKVGDGIELNSLNTVFGEFENSENSSCLLGSVKGQIGHCKAAAGVAGVIKAALSLYYKELPPTIRANPPLPALCDENSKFYVSGSVRPWISDGKHPRRAGVSAFGFGGSNFHCVMAEESSCKKEADWEDSVRILGISSDSESGLLSKINSLKGLSWSEFSRKAWEFSKDFNPSASLRLAAAVSEDNYDNASLAAKMEKAVREHRSLPFSEGIFFSDVSASGKTAFIFPGQGSQYPGMMKESACLFPEMTASLDLMEGAFSKAHGKKLSDIIYPVGRYGIKQDFAGILTETQYAQPALGAVALGNAEIMRSFGVNADFAAGHSYGELPALCFAGRIGRDDFAELSVLRGRLMGKGSGDRGSMCAVMSDYDTLSSFIEKEGLDVIIANRNAPKQMVLSGKTEDIMKAIELLGNVGITAKQLKVSAAFHSRFVADAAAPFASKAKEVLFNDASVAVYSNFSGKAYEKGMEQELIASQLANPVLFCDEISAMYEDGARVFIECGPRAGMTGLVSKILEGREGVIALSADSSNGKRSSVFDMALLLARLASAGIPVKLEKWNPLPELPKKSRFTVKICGANYKKERAIPASDKKYRDVNSEKYAPKVIVKTAAPEPAVQQTTSYAPIQASSASEDTVRMIEMMHARTADLHRQFLDNQRMAFDSFRRMFGGAASYAASPAPVFEPSYSEPAPVMKAVAKAYEQPKASAPAAAAVKSPAVVKPAKSPAVSPVQPPAVSKPSVDVFGAIVRTVAEKTGYPSEMLERGMDMESDLGIDSIKKVEIFSSLKDAIPEMPSIGASEMGSIRTLDDAVRAIEKALPSVSAASPVQPSAVSKPSVDVFGAIVRTVAEKTGYPSEMLERGMDMESDLGIDSIKKVEIFSSLKDAIPEMPSIGASEMGSIRTLDDAVRAIEKALPSASAASPVQPSAVSKPSVDVFGAIVRTVAEKTGYPSEMLERGMDMESDLGIDSIKKVEIFSSLKDAIPEMPSIGASEMGSIRTLDDAVRAIEKALPSVSAASPVQPSAVSKPSVDVFGAIVRTVAEKTGYPSEMLERGMDMESDLGIDSIKKVEIFSSLKDAIPEMPSIGASEMGSIRTLDDAVRAIEKALPSVSAASPVQPSAVSKPSVDVFGAIVRTVAEKTGYPSEMLERGMDMESDLGIDSIKKVEIFSSLKDAIPEMPSIGASEMGSIRTLDDAVRAIEKSSGLKAEPVPEQEEAAVNEETSSISRYIIGLKGASLKPFGFSGKIYVASDSAETAEIIKGAFDGKADVCCGDADSLPEGVEGLVIASSGSSDISFLEKAFLLEQGFLEGGGKLLASVSFMDGSFGLERGASNPVQGGLGGLVKTALCEYGIKACAIDFDPSLIGDSKSLSLIADAVLSCPAAEIGIGANGAKSVFIEKRELGYSGTSPLCAGDAVIVSGGGRGVTASCIMEIAKSMPSGNKPCFVLAGRTDISSSEEEWLKDLADEKDIKRAIMEHMDSPSPAAVGKKYRSVISARDIRETIGKIRALGAPCDYVKADVSDFESAKILVEKARSFGRIAGFIHGAGIRDDKAIKDMTADRFSNVVKTKACGAENILSLLKDDDLKVIAFFSSSTARFGRKGQINYAAANEILNKIAQREKANRKGCVVKSFNWGPWDGGMVNDGLRKLFESEGIGVIPLSGGGRFMALELSSDSPETEVTALVTIGDGFLGGNSDDASHRIIFSGEFSLKSYPVLESHVINGKAVVPAALASELIAQAVLADNPGFSFAGYDSLRINSGIKIGNGESVRFTIKACEKSSCEGGMAVPAFIETLDSKGIGVKRVSCSVILSDSRKTAVKHDAGISVSSDDAYKGNPYNTLFHGGMLQGIERVFEFSGDSASCIVSKCPSPEKWIEAPQRSGWVTDILAADCAFQLMILWTEAHCGKLSLPCFVKSMRRFANPSKGAVTVKTIVRSVSGDIVTADIIFADSKGMKIAVIEGYECVCDSSLESAFRNNVL